MREDAGLELAAVLERRLINLEIGVLLEWGSLEVAGLLDIPPHI